MRIATASEVDLTPVQRIALAGLVCGQSVTATMRMRTLLMRGTHVIADALQSDDQRRWAMRVIACPQVWKMGRRQEPPAETK